MPHGKQLLQVFFHGSIAISVLPFNQPEGSAVQMIEAASSEENWPKRMQGCQSKRSVTSRTAEPAPLQRSIMSAR